MPDFFAITSKCCDDGWKIFLLISAYLILHFFFYASENMDEKKT